MSGPLYRKADKRAAFQRCFGLLCGGRLLLFQHELSAFAKEAPPRAYARKVGTVKLINCYLYSGLVVEGTAKETKDKTAPLADIGPPDASRPGQHVLPRVYREDGCTSADEDYMTCFVLWKASSRALFRSKSAKPTTESDEEKPEHKSGKIKTRLRYISRLGVPGKSIIFRARSREERDRWVMALRLEIERSQRGLSLHDDGVRVE